MAVTIRQIAVVAGVSRGTVDRVLHNRPGVKPEIAEHVRKISQDLGYEPNRAGKILAARKQPLKIGCFLPSIGNPFFSDVTEGFHRAEAEFSDFGITIELREVKGYDVRVHIKAIKELVAAGCQALCVSTIDTPEMREYLDDLIQSGIPVVAVNTDLSKTKRLCYVGCDYVEAGRTAAGLLSLMTTEQLNLLIITGSLKMKGHNERIRGFSRTLREKQVSYKLVEVFESLDDDDHAYQKTLDALRAHPEINCVYIVAAGVAGICRAIQELGLEKKLHVLSYDQIGATCQLVRDGVIDFTIGQEPEEQGYRSIQLLFNYFMSDRRSIPGDYITNTVIKIKENLS